MPMTRGIPNVPILLLALILPFSSKAQTLLLTAEPNHSTVGFSISIAGFTRVTGKFTDFDLELDWNMHHPDSSSLVARIRTASILTGIPDRDEHLRSADFLHAEAYPEILFASDSVRRIDFSNYRAFGKLTVRGITRNYILPLRVNNIQEYTIGFSSRTRLNRTEFGVGTEFEHTAMPDFLADEVDIELDFWTRKRKE